MHVYKIHKARFIATYRMANTMEGYYDTTIPSTHRIAQH